jgi:hypothetical protein
MSGKMTDWESRSARVSKVVSCATKKPIADAQGAAGATGQEASLGKILGKQCFSVLLAGGAGIAVEVEE